MNFSNRVRIAFILGFLTMPSYANSEAVDVCIDSLMLSMTTSKEKLSAWKQGFESFFKKRL